MAKVFGIEAERPKDKKLNTLKASYKSLVAQLDPDLVAKNCATPIPLQKEFISDLKNYGENFSSQLGNLASMVSTKKSTQNNFATTAFFANLLNSCPRLNLELSLNEFKSGKPERY